MQTVPNYFKNPFTLGGFILKVCTSLKIIQEMWHPIICRLDSSPRGNLDPMHWDWFKNVVLMEGFLLVLWVWGFACTKNFKGEMFAAQKLQSRN